MRKQTIQYTSPLDALVTVAKRLSLYENQQHMDSETNGASWDITDC